MKNLVEIMGIPGSGKTYYLSQILESEATPIDFGTKLGQWLKKTNKEYEGPLPPAAYVKEFIDTLGNGNTPTVITSHIVHYKNGEFLYDLDCELYAKASAHIFIYSMPEDILSRRRLDNENAIRRRDVGSLQEVEKHQRISLEVTKKLSEELDSNLLVLENTSGREEGNILEIKNLLGSSKNE